MPDKPKALYAGMTTIDLVRSLKSTTCPSCGRAKRASQSLCLHCYTALPHPMRCELWNDVGDGYEQAMADAMNKLAELGLHKPGRASEPTQEQTSLFTESNDGHQSGRSPD